MTKQIPPQKSTFYCECNTPEHLLTLSGLWFDHMTKQPNNCHNIQILINSHWCTPICDITFFSNFPAQIKKTFLGNDQGPSQP